MKRWMGAFALLGLVACDKGDDTASGLLEGDPKRGESVFQSTCAQSNCHGPDGSGSDPSSDAADLAKVVPGLSDSEIESRIENGFGLMAPVDISEQETADVIAYVRQEFGG